jgi:hypothetical protein
MKAISASYSIHRAMVQKNPQEGAPGDGLSIARAARGVNLQTDAVRVFKENATGLRSFCMGHDAVINEGHIHALKSPLNFFDLRDGRGLEREMVEPNTSR